MYTLLVTTLLLSGAAVLSTAKVTIQTLKGEKAFNDFVEKNELAFVLFDPFKAWFNENYKKAAEEISKTNTNVKFASVDYRYDDNLDLFREYFEVSSYHPGIVFFKNHRKPDKREAKGATWSVKDIMAWMEEMISSSTT